MPPAEPASTSRCAVSGCRCVPTVRHALLCVSHAKKFRLRRPPVSLEQFLADRRVRPLPPMPACQVAACIRPADGAGGYCNTHYQRWRAALAADSEVDAHRWQARESDVAEPGRVNLNALPVLVVVEVLFGVQQRVRGGAKITNAQLRVLSDGLRRRQVISITADRTAITRNKSVRALRTALARHIRRALADPGSNTPRTHMGSRYLRPARVAIVHRNQPALTGRIGETVGGRTVAPSPRPRRGPGSRQDQRATPALGIPGPQAGSGLIASVLGRTTSMASSTGWPIWSPPALSAGTGATPSAVTCERCWPGSARWA
jgi:hypothetical protein